MGNITNRYLGEGGRVSETEGRIYDSVLKHEGCNADEIAERLCCDVKEISEPLCKLKDSGLIKAVYMFNRVRYFINRNCRFSVDSKTRNIRKRKSEINFVGIRAFCNAVKESTGSVFSEPFLKKLKGFVNEHEKILILVPNGVAVVETFVLNRETENEEKVVALVCVNNKKLIGHVLGFIK